MEIERELWEKALGRAALNAIEDLSPDLLKLEVEEDAVQILEEIRNILDDYKLDDFECIEYIVSVLERWGISTIRHDFG